MANGHVKSQQAVEAATKVKQRNRNDMEVQFKEGENAKFMAHALGIYNLPSIDLNNAEQVKKRILDYFQICINNDTKPSLAGVANALSISRQYLWEIANGKTSKNKDVVEAIQKVQYLLNQLMEDYLQQGKINPVSAIFLLKNNHNYLDEQKVIVQAAGEEKTSHDLIEEANLLEP